MTQKNNTARVAVKAKPCQKLVGSIELPTWQQTMLTALAFAQSELERLDMATRDEKNWSDSDGDVDVIFAMDLVLERVKRLRDNLPSERGAFDVEWYAAASVINLSVRAFSRPGSYYFRRLQFVQQLFEVFAPAVEFVERGEHHGK